MEFLQTYYNKLLDKCFAHPYVTLLGGIASVLVGIFLMGKLPQKLMPVADRNQFAVEIYLPTGSAVRKDGLGSRYHGACVPLKTAGDFPSLHLSVVLPLVSIRHTLRN